MEITKTTVNASDGHLEEHPESYHPRVFAAIMPPMQYRRDGEDGLTPTGREEKVYEILSNGQAIPWPCLPAKELCGFDFCVLYVESQSDVTMMRHAPQMEVEVQGLLIPRIPQAVWDALKESQDMAEKASQAACYPYHADIPALKPICPCRISEGRVYRHHVPDCLEQDMAEKVSGAIPIIKPIMGPDGKTQIGQIVEYDPIPQADEDSAPAAQRKPTMGDFYKQLERTEPRSEESDHISEKIIEAVFDVGCTCLKGGPGCDTWEEYPGQTWGEFAKNSECPIHGEDR